MKTENLKKAGKDANLALYGMALSNEDWRNGDGPCGIFRSEANAYKDAAKFCGATDADLANIEAFVLPAPCPQKMQELRGAFAALKKAQKEKAANTYDLFIEVKKVESTLTPVEFRAWYKEIKYPGF